MRIVLLILTTANLLLIFNKGDFNAIEYVHKNLREDNEIELANVLKKKLGSEHIYANQKVRIIQMLQEI